MASARINYNPNSNLGNRIARYVGNITNARKEGEELNRILDKYIDDTAAIAADSGIAATDVALVRNLVNQSSKELGGAAVIAINAGGTTASKQLADAMG
jgi:hypothetical protein